MGKIKVRSKIDVEMWISLWINAEPSEILEEANIYRKKILSDFKTTDLKIVESKTGLKYYYRHRAGMMKQEFTEITRNQMILLIYENRKYL